ncbi:LysR substrate-binding domain-containing protein [Bosea sp. RCC_152_1]|uniref:LysR substrate-binding domain-containing protein n=1 Tax=Bosea sp. RCC_152_1 TaxID=3239228 RepID=UPI00352599B4
MELRQFRQFIAVAEELNFRRAARRLNMAQPPLTAAIKRVEEELGALLIERTNRIARLTPAGQVFLEEATRTVAQAERAITVTRRAGRGLTGTLRVTFLASAMNSVLPGLLREFRERFPEVELDLEERPSDKQVSALLEERADIGFVALPFLERRELTIEILLEDHFVLALGQDHPLADRAQIDLAALAGEKWIMFPRRHGPALYEKVHMACANAGFAPDIAMEALGTQAMVGLVGGGLGVALVPRSLCDMDRGRVVFREIAGPGTPISYELAMAYGSPTPLREAFIAIARATSRTTP